MTWEEEEEPASPMAEMLQKPPLSCCILVVLGFSTTITNIDFVKREMTRTLLNHPRFSSMLIVDDTKGGKFSWKRTSVDIDNHVFAPDLDPNMESPDKFVEDFMSEISKKPMDMSKPLWESYILNVKTSEANSIAILKFHHSIGDGVSLISLLLACARKTSDPLSLPVLPSKKRKIVDDKGVLAMIKRLFVTVWTTLLIIFNTFVGLASTFATLLFLEDSKTPIKGERGVELSPKRFVHRIVVLDDVKLVKTALNVTINDVALGVVEAGLSRYLNKRYDRHNGEKGGLMTKTNFLPKNLRVRSSVLFNMRPSPTIEDLKRIMEKEKKLNGMWGNVISFVLIPFTIGVRNDPLAHVRRAKSTMDRIKLSLQPKFMAILFDSLVKLFGTKPAVAVASTILSNSTLSFSNVVGPKDEITIFGHPVSYIAPSVYGHPQALFIQCLSYADKFIISVGAEENLIPNPHKLCDDMVTSLEDMKDAVIKREC